MSYAATQRMTHVLEQIQKLHAEARQLSVDYDIPFHLPLMGANGYTTDIYFNPSDAQSAGWYASNC